MSLFKRNKKQKKAPFETAIKSASVSFSVGDGEEDTSWRSEVEDGTAYGVSPEDYDDEGDYEDALEQAKYGWRDEAEDNDFGLDPEDYETEAEYREALEAAKNGGADTPGVTVTVTIDEENDG